MKLFDAHCDTLTTAFDKKEGLLNNHCHINIEKAEKFENYSQLFAIWTDDTIKENSFLRFKNVYDYFLKEIQKNSKHIVFCKSKDDYIKARDEGKISAFLSIEGGKVLEGDINRIDYLYSLGVRVLSLTWNFENELACGVISGNKGLTPLGINAVKRIKKLNMALDVSHLSEKGFFDAASLGATMIATHSNSKSVFNHPRNITDEQYKTIIKTGGGAGINIYPDFICKNARICDIIRHVEHFLALGGEKHLFLGADFDGVDRLPDGMTGISSMTMLYDEMLKYYKEETVQDIFYNNLERIILKLY